MGKLKLGVLTLFSVLVAVLSCAPAQALDLKADLTEFAHVDPKNKVNDVALTRALSYFKRHKWRFQNKSYIGVIDYTKHSSRRRFYIIDLKSGAVRSHLTTHGAGSDPKGTGYAQRFSNREGSAASSIGFFRTAEVYEGVHGRSMKLDGLSSTNNNALERLVVIHGADYVREEFAYAGRSSGCPAIDMDVRNNVINKLQGGAMIYAYGGDNPQQF